jgi:hypothetical protein
MEPDQFCREIESHLCRRNAGHLVRLVGPAFEMVIGWARSGIPIRVACAGIDRYLERHDARTGGAPAARRRPVRVEFCEADVLDAYDQWRRAVGVGTAGAGAAPAEDEGAAVRPGHSLRAHLDRVATRLTDRLADGSLPPPLESHLERLLETLGGMRERAKTLRGEARQEAIARLQQLDFDLLAAVRASADASRLSAALAEADADLSDFRGRMGVAEFERARGAAVGVLLRDRCRLPIIAY